MKSAKNTPHYLIILLQDDIIFRQIYWKPHFDKRSIILDYIRQIIYTRKSKISMYQRKTKITDTINLAKARWTKKLDGDIH